jgi:hypothetical protein
MSFEQAMGTALLNAKYNKLTGRYIDWREWIAEKIMAIINWILQRLNPGALNVSVGDGQGPLFITGITVLLVVAVIITVITLNRRRRKLRLLNAVFEGVDQKATPRSLLEQAESFFSEGKTRDAARYCFAAVLLLLDERRILRVGITKTNRQLLRELRSTAPPLVQPFERISRTFDRVWFGHKELPAEAFADVKNEASAMITEAYNDKKAV